MADQAAAGQGTVGTYYFKLQLAGVHEAKFFKECTGLESSNEVVESTSIDEQGKALVQKFPGQLKWSNITLKRGVDTARQLWDWRQQVLDGDIAGARKTGTITVIDWKKTDIVVYTFVQAWPCRYSAPGLNAAGNEILVEEIEIAHEGFVREPGGAGA